MTQQFPSPRDDELPPSAEARDFATLFAALVLGCIAVGLVLLVSLVMPKALYLVVVVAGFGAYFLLHYLVWGRLMCRMLAESPPEDEAG